MARSVFAALALLLVACSSDAGVSSGSAVTAESAPVTSDPATTESGSTVESLPPLDSTVRPEGDAEHGIGDGLFPSLGNPGIDVEHYDVALQYDPAVNLLNGDVTATIRFTDDRSAFTLDSAGPKVSRVVVDGQDTTFRQEAPELFVDLPAPVTVDSEATVQVFFALSPVPNGSEVGIANGWFRTPHGSYVINEPDGASTWLPCNDHPSDKATWSFELTVPEGLTAVANGRLEGRQVTDGNETFTWDEPAPMATYLLQVLTGDYVVVDGGTVDGVTLQHVALRADRDSMQPYFDITADQLQYFESVFGPYPFAQYGIAVTDSSPGLAMETQGRSLFSRDDLSSGQVDYIQQVLLSHELAHQWFGDAVTPAKWSDIWLNEAFATYAQWLWLAHHGDGEVSTNADIALLSRPDGSTGSPAKEDLFGYDSYDGGAVVLHALRLTVGDDAFFAILREWVGRYRGTSRTTGDFIDLAEELSGKDLRTFFDTWLYSPRVPRSYPAP